MAKLVALLVIIFFIILSVLAFFNRGTVSLTLWEGYTYEIPLVALILIATSVGILSMFIVVAVRDARRYLDTWQSQRQQKKSLKIQEQYSRGLDAFFAKRYDEAVELFTQVVEGDPKHINAFLRLGDISLDRGDLTKAKDFYLKAKEINPRGIEVLFSLERVFRAQQKWQDALRCLDNILEIDDDNPQALYKKRDIYEMNEKWEELIEVQHRILKSDIPSQAKEQEQKNLLGYRYELGRYYLERGFTDKAIKTLKSILKTDRDFIAAYLTLVDAYLKEGDTKEAEALLLRGYEATSSPILLVRLEDFFISMGEPGSIIDLYQKAIQKDQRDLRLQFFLAKLYYRLEMIDYAFETVNAIDTGTFNPPGLHTLLGNIYVRRAEYQKAAEEFRKALRADKPLLIPFCCSNCSHISNDWIGRCPECKHWNTFTLDLDETCKTQEG